MGKEYIYTNHPEKPIESINNILKYFESIENFPIVKFRSHIHDYLKYSIDTSRIRIPQKGKIRVRVKLEDMSSEDFINQYEIDNPYVFKAIFDHSVSQFIQKYTVIFDQKEDNNNQFLSKEREHFLEKMNYINSYNINGLRVNKTKKKDISSISINEGNLKKEDINKEKIELMMKGFPLFDIIEDKIYIQPILKELLGEKLKLKNTVSPIEKLNIEISESTQNNDILNYTVFDFRLFYNQALLDLQNDSNQSSQKSEEFIGFLKKLSNFNHKNFNILLKEIIFNSLGLSKGEEKLIDSKINDMNIFELVPKSFFKKVLSIFENKEEPSFEKSIDAIRFLFKLRNDGVGNKKLKNEIFQTMLLQCYREIIQQEINKNALPEK